VQQSRLKRLAKQIDALVEKDDQLMQQNREFTELRRCAAVELHSICAGFVSELNSLLNNGVVEFTPAAYSPDSFKDSEPNLLQINVRGRILQIEFEATGQLLSTEEYRVPYTLEGAVRSFNQELLDRDVIEEQLLFYCVDKKEKMWRYFDARTYRTGPFDQNYLTTLMEKLL